jgi:preprotein translocase subunit SecG
MTVFPLLAVSFIMTVVAVIWFICALSLILVILIQKGRGGGLSGALGGGIASGILGSKTGDFLTWVTIVLVGIFLTLSVALAKFYKPTISDFGEGAPPVTAPPPEPTTSSPPPSTSDRVGTIPGSDSTDANSTGVR